MGDHLDAIGETQIFLTASSSYPALEQQFLQARSHIAAGFRVFDPRTKLRSDAGRTIGEDWYDLIAHTLRRGVAIRMILTDFDPIVRPDDHRMTWNAVRRFISAGEASGRPDLLHITPAMHPARIGRGSAAMLWPKVMHEITKEARRLNALPADEAKRDLSMMPLLAPYMIGDHPNLRANRRLLPRLVPTTHHQKVAVFDDTNVYIGGLDLDERRYDTPDHDRPGEQTWRDCQILTSGSIANEAAEHLNELLAVTSGAAPAKPKQSLLRTLSAPRTSSAFRLSPRPVVTELEAAHIDQIKKAQRFIYLETQFLRSKPIAKVLSEAAKANPDLQLLVLLPGAPEDVAFHHSTRSDARYGEYLQAKCIDMIVKAFGDRVLVTSPAQPRRVTDDSRGSLKSAPLIYVHSKVAIFDDTAAIVSSANLNGRSLRWDTEVGLTLTHREDVAKLTKACFQHWLPDDDDTELSKQVATWRQIAQNNAQTPPHNRDGFLLPYPIAPARRFGRNLPGVPEEMT